MNKTQPQRDEQLSALLDNALDKQQLNEFMQDLKRDPVADAETAQRYHLLGDVLRDELDQSSFMDISAAVHRSIEQEPSHGGTDEIKETSRVESLGRELAAIWSRWTRPVTGMAVAASVAMISVATFNVVQNHTDSQLDSPQLAKSAAQPVSPVTLEKTNPEIARHVRVASTLDTDKKSPQQQKQLNIYMLQHSGYASESTMQGMMPYVRAADVKSQEKD